MRRRELLALLAAIGVSPRVATQSNCDEGIIHYPIKGGFGLIPLAGEGMPYIGDSHEGYVVVGEMTGDHLKGAPDNFFVGSQMVFEDGRTKMILSEEDTRDMPKGLWAIVMPDKRIYEVHRSA